MSTIKVPHTAAPVIGDFVKRTWPAVTPTYGVPDANGDTIVTFTPDLTTVQQATTDQYQGPEQGALGVGGFSPAGCVVAWAGAVAPRGWLLCDGASYPQASYAALFSAIGTTYGGSAPNFNVPNLKGRFVVGLDAADATIDALGETGGAKTHTHAGHSAHAVTQPSAHSAHVVTQPTAHAAHGALANHAHELPFTKVAGGVGVLRMLASSIFGTGTSRAPESQSAAPVANTTAAAVALSEAKSAGTPDAHSAHAGTAVDAHSAHAGTAVDAHSVHDTPTAVPPYVTLNWIIKA